MDRGEVKPGRYSFCRKREGAQDWEMAEERRTLKLGVYR